MSKVSWVVETHVFNDKEFTRLTDKIKAVGCDLHLMRMIPFTTTVVGAEPTPEGAVILYGRDASAAYAKEKGWTPGVFGDDASFDQSAQQQALGSLLLNASTLRMPLKTVQAWIIGSEREKPFFIKPVGDHKQFPGGVMTVHDFQEWHEGLVKTHYYVENDFEVLVSEPQDVGCEWRVVVVAGQIVSSCLYRQYGAVRPEPHILPEVEALVLTADRLHRPAPVYVIDIAQSGGEFKIVEYNAFNSAGFYAGDIEAIVEAVTAHVQEAYP